MSNMSEQNLIKASVFVVKILTIGFSSLKRHGCSNLVRLSPDIGVYVRCSECF
jgi:hypothetical protein